MSTGERLAIFTRADLEYIDSHPDTSADELAERFGVPARSVAIARARINSDRVDDPWTKEDDDFVRRTPHLTQHQVGRYLGRSSTSIKTRRRLLSRLEGLGFGGSGPTKNPVHIGGRPLVAKTCTKCGLLLPGSWFHRRPKHSYFEWQSHCKKCHSAGCADRAQGKQHHGPRSEAGKLSAAALQAMTVPHASRTGQPWLESDDAVLRDPDLTVVEKALKLNRTYHATANACQRYGYKSKRVGLGDPERDQWLIHLPDRLVS